MTSCSLADVVSFAAELVLDHGWQPEQVQLEVDRLDVAAGDDPVRAPYLLAEAKLNDAGPAGLQAMLQVFEELAGGAAAVVARQTRHNAVPKYEALLRLRPAVFVAVAPGIRHWFTVNYPDAGRSCACEARRAGTPVGTEDRPCDRRGGVMIFRRAVIGDLDALIAIQEEGAVAGLGHIFPQDKYPFPRETVRARWAAELADPAARVFVCTDNAGNITGFAALREDELLHFGTAVSTWGTGLAQNLHDALLASFPGTVTRCRLRVFTDNRRARRFYEKLGWSSTGELTRSTFPPYAELVTYTRSVRAERLAGPDR